MKKEKNYRSSLAKRNVSKLLSNKLALVGLIMVVMVAFFSFCAPLFTPYDPNYIDISLQNLPMSPAHPLGTDQAGRDMLSRLLYGGRYSIIIGLVSAVGTQFIGMILGCLSGFYGGKVDWIITYAVEIISCFPQTILILIIIAFLGQGFGYMILIFALTGWTGTARVVRSRILALKTEPFVDGCRANGVSSMSIMFRHLLPNTLGVVIVGITLSVAMYVLAEAGLSFLGLGVPKGIPTWGNMLNAARSMSIMQMYPNLWMVPGIALSIFVLGVNFLGDGLRDVFDVSQ